MTFIRVIKMGLTNIYTKFAQLARSDLQIGTVVSVGAETSALTDLNGYDFTAIGTNVAAGQKAYVKDGVIISQAPTLAASEVFV